MGSAAEGMQQAPPLTAGPPDTAPAAGKPVFEVRLTNFTGPFDLLLGLIGKRELDITEIALAEVTDEFIAHIRRMQAEHGSWALDEASEFLVVAATLLDLKAARLLPRGEVEDDEDIALLEARDLLFARLLQYRAFKEISRQLAERFEVEGDRYPRDTPLEPQFAAMLPELIWTTTAEDLAALAAVALRPREAVPTGVRVDHLHGSAVSVREQAGLLEAHLRNAGSLSFGELIADAEETLVVVARFLALLEMFRDGVISFDQDAPLGELRVQWSGGDTAWSGIRAADEYGPESPGPGTVEPAPAVGGGPLEPDGAPRT
ncbi:segregation and condensation protein A [Arthrobacter sp. TMN-37]